MCSDEQGINVLSLFDGMACTRMALEVLGVKVNKYFACEIDKFSIQMSKHLYPDTVHLGDVQFVTANTFGSHRIDLIVGGSPCQGFSNAGKGLNFDDPRSALFFEFVRLVRELHPKYFLLENVKMKGEWRDIISEYMGVEPIFINSSLLSAQNRQRYYWTNIDGVDQPEDRGVFLRDILDYSVNDELSEKETAYMESGNSKWNGAGDRRFDLYGQKEGAKAGCLTANMYKGVPYRVVGIQQHGDKLRVSEATKKGYAEAGEGEGLDLSFPKSKTRRGRLMKDKSNCVTSAGQNMGVVFRAGKDESGNTCYVDRDKSHAIVGSIGRTTEREYFKKNQGQMMLQDDGVELKWRKLTVRECARLQTVPEHLIDRMMESGVSNSQMYKQLGNGFTVDVIAHILSFAKWQS